MVLPGSHRPPPPLTGRPLTAAHGIAPHRRSRSPPPALTVVPLRRSATRPSRARRPATRRPAGQRLEPHPWMARSSDYPLLPAINARDRQLVPAPAGTEQRQSAASCHRPRWRM